MAIITFGGDAGAGKTTLAPRIAKTLNFAHLYVGDLFRNAGKARGMAIHEFYPTLAENPDLERAIDQEQVAFMRANPDCVVQGRIAFYFANQVAPGQSIHVFLAVDPRVGAERQKDRSEHKGKTTEEIAEFALTRVTSEREHYKTLYGIEDHLDQNNFDIVLDTTHLTEEEAFERLLREIKNRLA